MLQRSSMVEKYMESEDDKYTIRWELHQAWSRSILFFWIKYVQQMYSNLNFIYAIVSYLLFIKNISPPTHRLIILHQWIFLHFYAIRPSLSELISILYFHTSILILLMNHSAYESGWKNSTVANQTNSMTFPLYECLTNVKHLIATQLG